MLKYIEQNQLTDLGRKQLATHFCLTPEYVNYLFRTELNTTPTEYVNKLRIRRIQKIMSEHAYTVKEAAELAGFRDQFYFARLFKRLTGRTPGSINTFRRNLPTTMPPSENPSVQVRLPEFKQ